MRGKYLTRIANFPVHQSDEMMDKDLNNKICHHMSLYVIVCHCMQLCSLSLIYFQGGRVPQIINHGQTGRWVVNYWQPSPDSIGSNLCKMDQMCCPPPPGQHIPPLSVHGGSRPPRHESNKFWKIFPAYIYITDLDSLYHTENLYHNNTQEQFNHSLLI